MMDNVNHPKHYEGSTSIECIESMTMAYGKEAVLHFCKCNAFKYLWRYKNKNGKEDLQKALWYCDKAKELIKEIYKKEYVDEQIENIIKTVQEHLRRLEADG